MEFKKSNILVIIVTYNAMSWIDKCIKSVLQSNIIADLYIIDNGSLDGTQDYIRKNFPDVIFIQNKYNAGFGKANNKGLQYALDLSYEYVYLLNQDAWIYPDTLELLLQVHKKYPDYGILSPIQLQGNCVHFDLNFLKGSCSYGSTPFLLEDLFFSRCADVYEVKNVMAAHWLISMSCLQQVGGFSPTFVHYGEDTNYIQRAIFHKFKIGIVPAALAVHDRENRDIDMKKILYFQYTDALIRFSSPLPRERYLYIKYILNVFKYMFAKHSLLPILYALRILRKCNQIVYNRKISKEIKCSFLRV